MIVIPEKMYPRIDELTKTNFLESLILLICGTTDSPDIYTPFMILPHMHWAKNLREITNVGDENTLKVFTVGETDYYLATDPFSSPTLLSRVEMDMRHYLKEYKPATRPLQLLIEMQLAIKDFRYKRIAIFQKSMDDLTKAINQSLHKNIQSITTSPHTMITEENKSDLIPATPYISLMLVSSEISEDTVMDDCKTATQKDIVLCLDSTDPADNKTLCEIFKELRRSAPTQFVSNRGCSILVDYRDLWKIIKALSFDYSNRTNSWLISRIYEIISHLISGNYNIILTYHQYKEGEL